MHIGMVSETYPPEPNGVALTVQGLVEGLRARGHRVTLVRPRQAADAGVPDADGTVRVASAAIPGYPALRFGLPAGRRLTRAWREDRPDALYVATEGPLGSSALRYAARLGIPATTGFHTRFDTYASHYGLGWLTPLVRSYLRRFHRRAVATLVPTDALARELRGLGVEHARVLHRAVDTQWFHPGRRDQALRSQWGAAPHAPVMLYVGRIAEEKNLPLAVRAFYAMRKRCPELRYVWVGDGPARHAVESAHPEFIFTGMLHGEALARHYASADMFVFPSLSETFGNVILEALASGLPTVAFDCGAAHECLRDGYNGIGVAPGDERGFVAACVRLMRDPHFAVLRQGARDSVANLNPDAVVAEFESILAGIATGAVPSAPRTLGFNGSSVDRGALP
ncbi:glycosyltransferase family 1 protein [Oleiagrimonas sp.]|jgi:glycosyltransferase involved in cell wall biosynthesis|uniref:glycosyltransferase family 4 protein n=1 Tax=Oleiagrimonas sp. TaxID=2010330 RepID=UPI00262FD4F8|nr:glycosyltransferase family 1 protein [Oleiagrimonas sp.]MDA3912875.1 glycosyltransferase family 1 protein [Oleiagrimonas sp.]